MCGIAGILLGPQVRGDIDLHARLNAMGDALAHRGPDDSGTWQESGGRVGLVHRRLSVIDVSPAGHQPMTSRSGRFVVVFNGEIYNHIELRKAVERRHGESNWRGHSDTETLLSCLEAWGIERTLSDLVGMYAFAVWDRRDRKFTLVRDRFGEKPLFYAIQRGVLYFASELKAIRALPEIALKVDPGALASYVQYGYVGSPQCIYAGFKKIPPGAWLSVSPDDVEDVSRVEPQQYWSAIDQARFHAATRNDCTLGEAEAGLESMLRTVVRGQMMADVPLGAFLSGGIDSSVVVAMMQAESASRVRTFTIGFGEVDFNEAIYAAKVAKHLGTEHTELYVSAGDALNVISRLPDVYDEPFADVSQIPTILVSQLTRRHVTVALSGDGGDELFAGYYRYFVAARLWSKLRRVPLALRHVAAHCLVLLRPELWDRIIPLMGSIVPGLLRGGGTGDRLHKAAGLLSSRTEDELYRRLVGHWFPGDILTRDSWSSAYGDLPELPTLIERMMAADSANYLPDDLLVKVDRASMSVSLETRAPFLDHRLFEYVWRLPLSFKVQGGEGKWLLRRVLEKHVPKELFDRPKMGFGVPIGNWLRTDLRDWAEDLLDETELVAQGYFNARSVRIAWEEHLSGRRNWGYRLWVVLMFQTWLRAGGLRSGAMPAELSAEDCLRGPLPATAH